jgi:hypothetical protein
MNKFIICLSSGEYLYNIEITSNYLDFKRTIDAATADHLNDFDSRFVLKRLRTTGQADATHSPSMLAGQRMSNSLSYTQIASSICSWTFLPPWMSWGRKPAADALVLKVHVESVSEFLILAGVADETGIELCKRSPSIRSRKIKAAKDAPSASQQPSPCRSK